MTYRKDSMLTGQKQIRQSSSTGNEMPGKKLQQAIADYLSFGTVNAPVETINFLLNQYVSSPDYRHAAHEFNINLIFESTRLIGFLTNINTINPEN